MNDLPDHGSFAMPALDVGCCAFAPGRVNLIGEHTDYNGGLALPFAIELGVTAVGVTAASESIEFVAADLGEHERVPLANPVSTAAAGWRAFAVGTVAELAEAGYPPRSASIELSGTLPQGSGLSSSAAFTLASAMALLSCSGHLDGSTGKRWPEPLQLARLGQRVEQRWAGAQTGLLDQLASLLATEGHATLIDFRSLEWEPILMSLRGHRLIVVDSGEHRTNAVSGYNTRREECIEAAHRMGKESLRDAQIQDLHLLPDELERRARHVISENGRVEQAVSALRTGDFPRLGRLLDASHASLRDDYEVCTPTVDRAVQRLREAGALGARMIGGGFGGSVLALLEPDTPVPTGALTVTPADGARMI